MPPKPFETANALPLVSLCVVAFNEEGSLPDVLSDIAKQDYPHGRIEVLLIDSGSLDGTRALMEAFTEGVEAASFFGVHVLDNPKKILPAGCNVALREYTGDVFIRVDAHARIPVDFVRMNIEVLSEGECVCGGARPTVASPSTQWTHTLLVAEESAFGSSIADYRQYARKEYVSAVFHAAFRREVIESVGCYDERLVRTEDNDYFYRVRKAGYRIRFDGRIHSEQIARSTLRRMLKQKWGNGYWIGRTMHVQPRCFRAYHFAPLLFVLALAMLLCIGCFFSWWPLLVCAALYMLVCVLLTARAAIQSEHRNIRFVALPVIFLLIHLSYGFGTLCGLLSGFSRGKESSEKGD